MKLQDKVIVITGGGNGIGRQLVLEAMRRGSRVGAVDIRQESLDETEEMAEAGDRIATYVVDITDREATRALPARIAADLGETDGLINNAGIIQPFVKLNDLGFDVIERVMNVNFNGTVNMVKAFLPGLLSRPVAHIANVSSMGGFLPVPGQTFYGASKAAVKLMTEGLYAELLETNVGVSVIMPGAIGTEITKNSGVDMPEMDIDPEEAARRTTPPDEAARIILDGIEDDQLHIYVGRDSMMMNIFTRVAPKRATKLIQRQMKDLIG